MSALSDEQFEQWQQAIGRQQTRSQYLDIESARRYAVAAGLAPDELSALVHWAWFLEAVPNEQIGPDGHPKRGAFLPDISLPRRMFASSKIQFHQALKLEQHAENTIEVKDLFRKSGGQGELVFAKVERNIRQADELCIREVQTIVYRDMGEPVALPADECLQRLGGDKLWCPNTVDLFRFSSVTFNSHRIHYDQTYARETEGYPELIVHGPFSATRLADFAARRGALAEFEFRGLAPLFQGQQVILRQVENNIVQALRCDGVLAVEAKVKYQ